MPIEIHFIIVMVFIRTGANFIIAPNIKKPATSTGSISDNDIQNLYKIPSGPKASPKRPTIFDNTGKSFSKSFESFLNIFSSSGKSVLITSFKIFGNSFDIRSAIVLIKVGSIVANVLISHTAIFIINFKIVLRRFPLGSKMAIIIRNPNNFINEFLAMSAIPFAIVVTPDNIFWKNLLFVYL